MQCSVVDSKSTMVSYEVYYSKEGDSIRLIPMPYLPNVRLETFFAGKEVEEEEAREAGPTLSTGGGEEYCEGQTVNADADENETNNAGVSSADDNYCEDKGISGRILLEENEGFSKITFVCPECQQVKDNRQRPVQEVACRHTKCRQCYIASEEGCRQCTGGGGIPESSREEETHSPANTDSGISGEDENEHGESDNDEHCPPPPPAAPEIDEETFAQMDSSEEKRFKFELEQSSGVKIKVNVSLATLKELGVLFEDTQENVDVSKNSDSLLVGVGDVSVSTDERIEVEDVKDEDMNVAVPEDKVGDVDMGVFVPKDEVEDVDNVDVSVPMDNVTQVKIEVVDIDIPEGEHSSAADISLGRKSTTRASAKRKNGREMALPTPPKSKKITKKGVKKVRKNMEHIIKLEPEEDGDSDQPSFKCLKCKTDFYKYSQRLTHVYCNPANGRSPYICKYCSKHCANGSHLMYHERSRHTGEKPFSCHVCDRRFFLKVKLNRHMSMHDKSLGKPQKQRERPKRYTCAYCSKRFPSMGVLKKHLSTHSEGRPFECPACHKKLKTKEILNSHMKYHHDASKELNYKCYVCERPFFYFKDLKRHYLTHSENYSFVCTICKAKTNRKDNFMRHLRTVHKLTEEEMKKMCEDALEAMGE